MAARPGERFPEVKKKAGQGARETEGKPVEPRKSDIGKAENTGKKD